MTAPVFVVIGMHRTGTSLAASMLEAAGVSMCTGGCRPGDATQPFGYWEDLEFSHLNRKILREAGGSWAEVPHRDKVAEAVEEIEPEMVALIEKRISTGEPWGFKDPRNCLTALHWHRLLVEAGAAPRYVVTLRSGRDIVSSLMERNGGCIAKWAELGRAYGYGTVAFLSSLPFGVFDYIGLQFDRLVKTETDQTVRRLAHFIDKPEAFPEMRKKVRKRNEENGEPFEG